MVREVRMGSLDFILHWLILEDDSCAQMYEFLQELMRAFESHYGAQLNAYYCEAYSDDMQGDQRNLNDEIPF